MNAIRVAKQEFINKGKHCRPNDFFTIHYKGFMQEGSKMIKVQDTHKVNQWQDGKPLTFQQGKFQVVKCWDISVLMLHAGEKVKISCPAYLSHGGRTVYSQLSN